LNQQDIYPPIGVLPSLSRLMKDGIGERKTRDDHPNLMSQLYAAYAHVQDARSLASVIGEEELTMIDQKYLSFGKAFEEQFIKQSLNENRSISQTLDLGWKLLSLLPETELTRLTESEIKEHYQRQA
jgi:V/A-type H+-transporting ATPase subunit B